VTGWLRAIAMESDRMTPSHRDIERRMVVRHRDAEGENGNSGFGRT
jgi:hypothetical protein